MKTYEYQVVPAPKKGEKAKTAKTTADRFALALTGVMNKMGAQGWSYIRADTLPCDERVGLTGSKTVFQHMLVFRREIQTADVSPQPLREVTTPPLRREPTLYPMPVELFTDTEPSKVSAMENLPKRDAAVVAKAE
jgi:hypothetical protein